MGYISVLSWANINAELLIVMQNNIIAKRLGKIYLLIQLTFYNTFKASYIKLSKVAFSTFALFNAFSAARLSNPRETKADNASK